MEKQYTNFKQESFSSIDQLFSEADTLLSIINGYMYKYKIFNEVDKQHIVGNIILELNKRIESQSLTGGYIHKVIKHNILMFLRPVVKSIKYQLEESNDFAASAVYEDNTSTTDFYSNYQLLKEYLPTKWLELDERTAKGESLPNDEKAYKSIYKDTVWWMVENFHQLDKLFASSDFYQLVKTNDFPYLFTKYIQMYYLFKNVYVDEEKALYWRCLQNLSKIEVMSTLKITKSKFRSLQYESDKIIKRGYRQ